MAFTGQLGTAESQLGWIVLGGPAIASVVTPPTAAAAGLVVGDRPAGSSLPAFPTWAASRPRTVYDVGDLVDLLARFTDPETGDPVEPDTVNFELLSPSGDVTAPACEFDVDEDFFVARVALDQSRLWRYRVEGSGDWQAAGERGMWVRSSAFN